MKTPPPHKPALKALPGSFAFCRLPASAALPAEALQQSFFSLTRTLDELSLVLPDSAVPPNCQAARGWRVLQAVGTLDFGLIGVLAGISGCLARAGVSILSLSTYDTDYIFVREPDLERACDALEQDGYRVER